MSALVVPIGSALPISIRTGRSSIGCPDRQLSAVKIESIFPVFSHVKVSPILGRSAQTLTFSELRGPSYGPKRLSSLVPPSVRRKDDPSPPLRSSRRDSRFEKKKGPQTPPEWPKNHPANSRFHISPIPPLKWRSNPNPCTKTRIQPYGSKECANFKKGTPSDLDEHPHILA